MENKQMKYEKIFYVQTEMFESELTKLKAKTGEKRTGEALRIAIEKYLER